METKLIQFEVKPGDLFNQQEPYLFYTISGYPKLSGFTILIEPSELPKRKSYVIRHTLETLIKELYKGRKPALEIQGYGNGRHLAAIDRLNLSIPTLKNITDLRSFLSYCESVIIPDLWKLCPGPTSPFKNYKSKLSKISSYIKSELHKQKNLVNETV